MAMIHMVVAREDGTFDVIDNSRIPYRMVTGAELDAWLADMEQRIAQAKSHT